MDKSGGVGKNTVAGRVGRFTLLALLVCLLILDLVLIAKAANAFNGMINNMNILAKLPPGTLPPPGVTPPPTVITPYVLLFALIDGGFLGAGILLGLSHVFLYNAGSVGPAFTAAVFAWGINFLTLGFVWKEINLAHGHQGGQQKTIEDLVIAIAFLATIYVLTLFAALHHSRLGVGYHSSPV